mmetsp:Transcript_12135/g.29294  ORF Transcript_12135/g.29294 Transcript_12135/m.29294 type:complete len:174 (+) Transcript_12135:77-598(+)
MLCHSGAHPFHLHLYHMKIVSPGGCGAHKEGEFYDTISANNCVVRFKAIDIGQRMVMHCHVLSHEDNGAMQWMNVLDAPNPNNEDSPAYTCSGNPAPTTVPTSLTAFPTESPVPTPVTSPPTISPVDDDNCSKDECSSNSDCCSGKCNRKQKIFSLQYRVYYFNYSSKQSLPC